MSKINFDTPNSLADWLARELNYKVNELGIYTDVAESWNNYVRLELEDKTFDITIIEVPR